MNATDQDVLRKRLLYILHMGFVEVRNVAKAAGNKRLADLGDALEMLPRYLDKDCTADDLEMIRFALKTYQDKHQSNCPFPALLDECEAPQEF